MLTLTSSGSEPATWTFLDLYQGPTAYEAAALLTELKVHYQVIPGMLRILRYALE